MSPEKNDWNLSKANVDTVMESMFIASSDGKKSVWQDRYRQN